MIVDPVVSTSTYHNGPGRTISVMRGTSHEDAGEFGISNEDVTVREFMRAEARVDITGLRLAASLPHTFRRDTAR